MAPTPFIQSFAQSKFLELDLKRLEDSLVNAKDQTGGLPSYEFYSPSSIQFWPQLPQRFSEYIIVASCEGELMAAGYAVPFAYAEDEGLPAGWDEVLKKAFDDLNAGETTTAMSMLFVQVSPSHQRKGLSQLVLKAFKEKAQAAAHRMFVPCRPMLKHRFPKVPIEEYCQWTTENGQVFDPWLRLHLQTGRLVQAAPSSLIIRGTREQWLQWSGIDMQTEGDYEVAGALSLIQRLATGEIVYHEPNVWIEASLNEGTSGKGGTETLCKNQKRVGTWTESSCRRVMRIMGPRLGNLPAVLQEFCKDYACFYGPVAVAIWLLLDTFASSAWQLAQHVQQQRVLVVFGSTLGWAWFLQAFYLVIQGTKWGQSCSILHGPKADELRLQFGLKKHGFQKTPRSDMLGAVLLNQSVYFGMALVVCLHMPDGFSVLWSPGWAKLDRVCLQRVLVEVAVCLVLFDLLLGASHCVLHSKHFYKYHKKHHQIKADLPISSWYMSVVDMAMELWIPIFVPPLLLGMSWVGLWVWLLVVEFDGVHSHAGLDFGWPVPSPKRHYLHHILLTKNYSNGILDAILDTEAQEVERINLASELISQRKVLRKCRSSKTLKISETQVEHNELMCEEGCQRKVLRKRRSLKTFPLSQSPMKM